MNNINYPALKDLSPKEVKKQIRRWRYYRKYLRKKYKGASDWEWRHIIDSKAY